MKLFPSLHLLIFGLLAVVIENHPVFAAALILPYKDSFEVLQSQGFSHTGTLQIIFDAEQARLQHGSNLTKIAYDLRDRLSERHDHDWHCFVNIGEMRGSFFAKPNYIYLRSDSGDNMHIVCFKTPWVDVPGTLRVNL